MSNNVKSNLREYKFVYISVFLAILIFILMVFGYNNGYRVQENFLLGKVGTLSIKMTMANTNIFIDDNKKIITSKENELIEIPISPKKHTIIIAREGYFPWKKDFSIKSEERIEFSPVLISNSPSGLIITNDDTDFWKIRSQIISDRIPTKELPRTSKDGKAKLWVEDNAVKVLLNERIFDVIEPDSIIRNIFFYKDRSDVLIFSISNAVYAIEVDKTGTQNFLPIYKGTAPSFIEGDLNYIYVLDGNLLMQVMI